ncbi:MAG: macrolide ABC transporter ATP-binding protein [Pseudonocardiales bacterium]|nr:MAG: macrolide ABC transporter ATP-binding protein [Pseudonocardiales bacterium]
MGPSGSGKSTLLNVVAGIMRPTRGTINVLGLDLATASALRITDLRLQRIGYVFQNINLLPDLTLAENVALPLEATGTRQRRARRLAIDQLEVVAVADLADRFPGEVSGGERQRAAIARAVVGDRRILLADEPTGALDSDTGDQVLATIRAVCARGATALVSTHNPRVGQAADRILSIRNGRLRASADGAALASPAS